MVGRVRSGLLGTLRTRADAATTTVSASWADVDVFFTRGTGELSGVSTLRDGAAHGRRHREGSED
jgi:hypothetical protein